MYGIVTTDAGRAVLAQLGTGLELIITRVSFGSGRITSEKPTEQADLIHRVADGTSDKPTADGTGVHMTVEYRNNLDGGLKEGFYINEYGVWGKAGESGQEALILYASLGEHPQWIDAYAVGLQSRRYPLHIELSSDANVELSYQALSFLTHDDLGKPGGVAQLADNGALPITQGGTGAGTAEGARANIGAAANRNLVDNWDFAYAIDQRGKGKSGGYTGNGYSLDRWLIHDQYNTLKVYLQDDCLVLDNPSDTHNGQSWLVQKAAKGISADVVTLSILVQSVVGNVWIRANEKDFVQLKVGLNTLTASPDTKNNYVYWFVVEHNAKLVARAVKTEQGTVSTLVQQKQGQAVLNDVFDYPAELAKCQRYQMPLDGAVRYRAVQVQADVIMFFVPTPVTMAATPTIEPEHIDKLLLYDWAGTPQTGFTFAAHSVASNGIIITATKTKHGLQDAFLYANAFMGAGAPMLSANL